MTLTSYMILVQGIIRAATAETSCGLFPKTAGKLEGQKHLLSGILSPKNVFCLAPLGFLVSFVICHLLTSSLRACKGIFSPKYVKCVIFYCVSIFWLYSFNAIMLL